LELKEYYCPNRQCPLFQRSTELPVDKSASWPRCPHCSEWLCGRASAVIGSHPHWAWRVQSAKNPNEPERVRIDTRQKQREFCEREHLIDPWDLPEHLTISPDGKRFLSLGRGEARELHEEIRHGKRDEPKGLKPIEGVDVRPVEVTPQIASEIG